jgi:acyl-ACP thioesterase
MDVYESTQKICFNDVDLSGRITPFAVFNYFQDAAAAHAEIIGVGYKNMLANNSVWVLSRISVIIEKRPKIGDTVILRTWPRGSEKLFCIRDYDVKDSSGVLVRARSAWIILDTEKRRPIRPDNLKLPLNEGLDAILGSLPPLNTRSNLTQTAHRKAAYSDIDFNGHLNNARYIQWIQDIIPSAALADAEQIKIDINYLNEIKDGDNIELFTGIIDDSNKLAVEGRKDSSAAFKAEIEIKPALKTLS